MLLYEYPGIITFWCCNRHYAKDCSTKPKKTGLVATVIIVLLFDYELIYSSMLAFRFVPFRSVLLFCCCCCIVAWRGLCFCFCFVCAVCFSVWFSLLLLLLLCCAIFIVCFLMVHCGVAVVSMRGFARLLLVLTIPLHSPSHTHTHAHTCAYIITIHAVI